MTRVHIACEGPTELTFVREVLQPSLSSLQLLPFFPGKYESASKKSAQQKGKGQAGDIRYARVFPDFLLMLWQEPNSYCTTLFDYYALGTDFPEFEKPVGSEPHAKAQRIELAVGQDIANRMGRRFNPARFRCFLAMHEFEGLLFSAPTSLALALGRPDLAASLQSIRDEFTTPEHINNSRETAPSKRLINACSGGEKYDKVTGGNLAALEIGLDAMRRECAHFRGWLEWLESLA